MADWVAEAKEILAVTPDAVLATATASGTPRAVVVGAELQSGELRWLSLANKVHSQQVAENPVVAFNFYDPAGRREVYGVARVISSNPEEGELLQYVAKVSELWVVVDVKDENGEFIPPQQLEPSSV